MAATGSSQKFPKSRKKPTPDLRAVAAVLMAADELTDEQIAEKVGVTRRTLTKWRSLPEFAAEVERIRSRARAVVESHALGTVAGRMAEYQHRHDLMKRVIEERSEAGGDAPGAGTGLLVKTFKIVGGQDSYPVEEWQVDTGLLKEMRELEKQVSIEQGQWAEKKEITGANGVPLTIVFAEREDGPK